MENEKIDINKQLKDKHGKIVKELEQGKDIMIRNTGKGIKVQSLKPNLL